MKWNSKQTTGERILLSETYSDEIESFAHLFDFNLSMLCSALTPEIRDLIPKDLIFPQHKEFNLSDDRISVLLDILEDNISKITDKKYYRIGYVGIHGANSLNDKLSRAEEKANNQNIEIKKNNDKNFNR